MFEIYNYDPPRPYAACTRVGELLFLAGETGYNTETGAIPESIEEQAELALRNVERSLKNSGSDLAHLVRMTVYLTDITELRSVSEIRQRILPHAVPSATVGVAGLASPNMKIEIEATAVIAG